MLFLWELRTFPWPAAVIAEQLILPAQLILVIEDVKLKRATEVLQKELLIMLHRVMRTCSDLFWTSDKPEAITKASLDALPSMGRVGLLVSHVTVVWPYTKFSLASSS